MKMSKRQEIEAARCNDTPPERGDVLLLPPPPPMLGLYGGPVGPGSRSYTALSQGGSQGQTKAPKDVLLPGIQTEHILSGKFHPYFTQTIKTRFYAYPSFT